jgi:DNA-binding CsgD family transcriptional regulator
MLTHDLACVALAQGDTGGAAGEFAASLAGWRELGNARGAASALAGLAGAAAVAGRAARAARLFGAAEAARRVGGGVLEPTDRAAYTRHLAAAQAGLAAARFAAAWEAGRAMALEEAIAEALADPPAGAEPATGPSGAGAARARGGAAGLTAREAEVLRLLAGGRSNRGIAADLVLSVRTVERHIANIYAKAGVHNRAEATGYAARHGLVDVPWPPAGSVAARPGPWEGRGEPRERWRPDREDATGNARGG